MKKLRIGALLLISVLLISLCASSLAAYATLRYGDSGSAVKKMQVALVKLGYSTGGTDGKFGPTTRTTVRAFQKDNKLTVDGVAGNKTLTLLYKKAGNTQSSNGDSGDSASYFMGNYATLKKGATGSRVKLLQKALNKLGYSCGTADGKFGSGTRNAVIRFQKANGLTADGAAGARTLKKIEARLAAITSGTQSGAMVSGYIIPTRTLRKGASGDDVKSVQRRLKALGYYAGKLDGNYGAGTVETVKVFQQQNGLSADGSVGKKTREALFSTGAKKFTDPYPAKGKTLLAVARSQRGYKGNSTRENITGIQVTKTGYWTKYGAYTGENGEYWCASFVSWCGMAAGDSRINKTAVATPSHLATNYNTPGAVVYFNNLNDRQRAAHPYLEETAVKARRKDVKPAAGDLIFFRWSDEPSSVTFSHVGVVSKVSGGKVYYIDGCGEGYVVTERSVSLTSPDIAAYCKLSGAFNLSK